MLYIFSTTVVLIFCDYKTFFNILHHDNLIHSCYHVCRQLWWNVKQWPSWSLGRWTWTAQCQNHSPNNWTTTSSHNNIEDHTAPLKRRSSRNWRKCKPEKKNSGTNDRSIPCVVCLIMCPDFMWNANCLLRVCLHAFVLDVVCISVFYLHLTFHINSSSCLSHHRISVF